MNECLEKIYKKRLRFAAVLGCIAIVGGGCGNSVAKYSAADSAKLVDAALVVTCAVNTSPAFGPLERSDDAGHPQKNLQIVNLPIACLDGQQWPHWPDGIRRGRYVDGPNEYIVNLRFLTYGDGKVQFYTQRETSSGRRSCGTMTLFAVPMDSLVQTYINGVETATTGKPLVDCRPAG